MAKRRTLYFSIDDRAGGHDVTPETVPLGLLRDFIKDVATFVRGADKALDPFEVLVTVVDGSFALQSYEELPADLPIWHDIEKLSRGHLDGVDAKRAGIAEKWRLEAMRHPNRVFKIADSANDNFVAINADTFFFRDSASNWVLVERYLSGTVEDWGGLTSPNIHLRLEDGSTLKVDATREQIRDQELNPVYHEVLIRVELEEELVTGEKRNAKFLGFADYQPRIDEADYRKATEAGRAAWREVEDAADWVRGIRGGKE